MLRRWAGFYVREGIPRPSPSRRAGDTMISYALEDTHAGGRFLREEPSLALPPLPNHPPQVNISQCFRDLLCLAPYLLGIKTAQCQGEADLFRVQ